jgi:cytoskeletal protein CcmA (bactofilin family)
MFERGKKEDSMAQDNRSNSTAPTTQLSAQRSSGEVAVIGRSIKISGDLRGEEDLRIEGDVSGTVELRNSSLTIGREGRIKADVYAKSITVDGVVEGDLYASECVNIRAHAQVLGNVTSPRVGIEDGAKFKGAVEMDQQAVDRSLGKSATNGAAKPTPDLSAKISDSKMGSAVKEFAPN